MNYLSDDLKCLLEIMNVFSKQIYLKFNVDITHAMTISRLALNIFYKRHYNYKYPLPLIRDPDLFNLVNNGYYGGITEVYIPHGKNLKYIDVNSLYPFAALNQPLPG